MSRKHPKKYYMLKRIVDSKKWDGTVISPKGKVIKVSYNDYVEITEDEYKLANLGK